MKIRLVDDGVVPSYYIEILGINSTHGHFLIGLSFNKLFCNHKASSILCSEDVAVSRVHTTGDSTKMYPSDEDVESYRFDVVLGTDLNQWWIIDSNIDSKTISISLDTCERIINKLNGISGQYV